VDAGAESGGAAHPGKRTLAEIGKGHLATRVGVDPNAVQVHEDGVAESMGAKAVARGSSIHFAKGMLQAANADFLIAHELVHVVQQGLGAPGAQAKREGGPAAGDDRGLEAEADHVGMHVAGGGSAAGMIAGHAAAGSAQKFDSYEHMDIGDTAAAGDHGETKMVELAPGYRVTYGEMVALGGDYFGSIETIRAIAKNAGKGAGTREEIEYVRRVHLPQLSNAEVQKRTKEFSKEAVHAADVRYYNLASHNSSHFANPEAGDASKSTLDKANETHTGQDVDSMGNFAGKMGPVPNNAAGFYRANHLKAIGEAMAAGKKGVSIDSAMAANAFSDHFLTDSFSAGHLRTARTSASSYWNEKEPMFFVNFKGYLAEKLAYYINDHNTLIGIATVDFINDKTSATLDSTLKEKGMPDFQFGDLVCGTIHDYDNEKGVSAQVDGQQKTLFGDDHLQFGDTKDVVVKATKASIADITAAWDAGKNGQDVMALYKTIAPTGMFRSEQMMPVIKPDAELDAKDRSIKWDYPDVNGLMNDTKFKEGLKIFLKAKKDELANVGAGLDADYKREAFKNAIVANMEGDKGIQLIWSVLKWTPNTGGGVGGHNQDDNAMDYYAKAKKTKGGLASLKWEARADLIKDLVDGYTSGDEEAAILDLLVTCTNDSDVRNVIKKITWARLEDEVGKPFVAKYPKATYGH
jgi:hypothetical protein